MTKKEELQDMSTKVPVAPSVVEIATLALIIVQVIYSNCSVGLGRVFIGFSEG